MAASEHPFTVRTGYPTAIVTSRHPFTVRAGCLITLFTTAHEVNILFPHTAFVTHHAIMLTVVFRPRIGR